MYLLIIYVDFRYKVLLLPALKALPKLAMAMQRGGMPTHNLAPVHYHGIVSIVLNKDL